MRDIHKVAFWTGKWSNPDQTNLLVLDVDLQSGDFKAYLLDAKNPDQQLWTARGTGGFSDKLNGKYHDPKDDTVRGQLVMTVKSKQTTGDLSGNQISCRTNSSPAAEPDVKSPEVIYTNLSGPSALIPKLEESLESMGRMSQRIKDNAQTVDQVRAVIAQFAAKGMNVGAAVDPLEDQRDKMLEFVNLLKVRLHLLNYASEEFANLIQPMEVPLAGLLTSSTTDKAVPAKPTPTPTPPAAKAPLKKK